MILTICFYLHTQKTIAKKLKQNVFCFLLKTVREMKGKHP